MHAIHYLFGLPNKFGRSGYSLCSIIMFPTQVYTDTIKMITKMLILETLSEVGQFENAMRFKKCDFKPHLSKLGLSYRCVFNIVTHSNKQTGP